MFASSFLLNPKKATAECHEPGKIRSESKAMRSKSLSCVESFFQIKQRSKMRRFCWSAQALRSATQLRSTAVG
jgi:hypothetical protein